MEENVTTQFVPASPGWLALFAHEDDGELVVHAEPVIAWCLGVENGGSHHYSFGQAVVGANPWIRNADPEDAAHLFALVRESQLEPEFLKELSQTASRSRESILEQARKSEADSREGHASWVRNRRRRHTPA